MGSYLRKLEKSLGGKPMREEAYQDAFPCDMRYVVSNVLHTVDINVKNGAIILGVRPEAQKGVSLLTPREEWKKKPEKVVKLLQNGEPLIKFFKSEISFFPVEPGKTKMSDTTRMSLVIAICKRLGGNKYYF